MVDYIDLTPGQLGGEKKEKVTVFQETEWHNILNNPSGLTREGVQAKIKLWKSSSNRHVVILYETMLKRCKQLAESGISSDGKVILGRHKDGSPRWLGEVVETPKMEKGETKSKK